MAALTEGITSASSTTTTERLTAAVKDDGDDVAAAICLAAARVSPGAPPRNTVWVSPDEGMGGNTVGPMPRYAAAAVVGSRLGRLHARAHAPPVRDGISGKGCGCGCARRYAWKSSANRSLDKTLRQHVAASSLVHLCDRSGGRWSTTTRPSLALSVEANNNNRDRGDSSGKSTTQEDGKVNIRSITIHINKSRIGKHS